MTERSAALSGARQFLLRKTAPTIEPEYRIKNILQLQTLLQEAVELEHFTIPPYLCALYSIQEGTNQEAVRIIRSVVMEEMLHMVLAANLLNAIGGRPSINHPQFIPRYPAKLPVIDEDFVVNLGPFSKAAINTFVKIERPGPPKGQPRGCSCISDFHTIGQFYEAIELGLRELSATENIFTGDPSRQITPEHYYGAGGRVNLVTDLASALVALKEIVGQGEGVHHTVWTGDDEIGGDMAEVAHYFRFKEILAGRRYRAGDTVHSEPSGERFQVCWDKTYSMTQNPKVANYAEGSELRNMAETFNRTYMSLLNELHAATNGEPSRLMRSVATMYQLKYKAIELMKIPTASGDRTAGPSFEYCAL
jgi:hypothetical protein